MAQNYTQQVQTPAKGEAITAAMLNKLMEAMFNRIKSGRGILVKRIGQNIIVEAQSGVGGGGASGGIQNVESLPAIPTSAGQIVFWVSAGAGTGDDQYWGAGVGDTEWSPMMKVSSRSGVPV